MAFIHLYFHGNSIKVANRVAAVTGLMPGMLYSRLSRSRQSGLARSRRRRSPPSEVPQPLEPVDGGLNIGLDSVVRAGQAILFRRLLNGWQNSNLPWGMNMNPQKMYRVDLQSGP